MQTAERLYATQGISEVSNRQVAEAAGSANNSAVGYYIGSKTDLIEAILKSHSGPIANRMRTMINGADELSETRDLIECLVRPYPDHLAQLGPISYLARIGAQVATDPTLIRRRVFEMTFGPILKEALVPLQPRMSTATNGDAELRELILRNMIIHTCAEQERKADSSGIPADWNQVGASLTDSMTGILTYRGD